MIRGTTFVYLRFPETLFCEGKGFLAKRSDNPLAQKDISNNNSPVLSDDSTDSKDSNKTQEKLLNNTNLIIPNKLLAAHDDKYLLFETDEDEVGEKRNQENNAEFGTSLVTPLDPPHYNNNNNKEKAQDFDLTAHIDGSITSQTTQDQTNGSNYEHNNININSNANTNSSNAQTEVNTKIKMIAGQSHTKIGERRRMVPSYFLSHHEDSDSEIISDGVLGVSSQFKTGKKNLLKQKRSDDKRPKEIKSRKGRRHRENTPPPKTKSKKSSPSDYQQFVTGIVESAYEGWVEDKLNTGPGYDPQCQQYDPQNFQYHFALYLKNQRDGDFKNHIIDSIARIFEPVRAFDWNRNQIRPADELEPKHEGRPPMKNGQQIFTLKRTKSVVTEDANHNRIETQVPQKINITRQPAQTKPQTENPSPINEDTVQMVTRATRVTLSEFAKIYSELNQKNNEILPWRDLIEAFAERHKNNNANWNKNVQAETRETRALLGALEKLFFGTLNSFGTVFLKSLMKN